MFVFDAKVKVKGLAELSKTSITNNTGACFDYVMFVPVR